MTHDTERENLINILGLDSDGICDGRHPRFGCDTERIEFLNDFINQRVAEAENNGWNNAFKHISKQLVISYGTAFQKEGVMLYLPAITEAQNEARQSERTALREKVDSMKRKIPLGLNPEEHEDVKLYNSVFNNALSEVLDLLNQ